MEKCREMGRVLPRTRVPLRLDGLSREQLAFVRAALAKWHIDNTTKAPEGRRISRYSDG